MSVECEGMLLLVHLVWATKCRAPLIAAEADDWLHAKLRVKSAAVGAAVIAVGNAADHVHGLAEIPPTLAVAVLAKRLKGATSRMWNLEFAEREPFRWQRGYWAAGCAASAVAPLAHYIERQRVHHADPVEPEPWELGFALSIERT